jgi:hypothetical protein
LDKSLIFFFNTPPNTQRNIVRTLGFASSSLPSKYLGTPLITSAIKHSTWKDLIEKLTQNISSCTFRTLNLVGHLVLIKVILQTMSLYLFSVLAATKWVLNSIYKIQCTFLWSGDNNIHKWALVKWDTIYLPKHMGGLSIRDQIKRNEALSAKMRWNWISKRSTPWAYLWHRKYAPNWDPHNLIRFTPTSQGSLIWNSTK